MSKRKKIIEEFFSNYEQNFNNALGGADMEEHMRQSFASCFVESSPGGVVCGQNDAKFLENMRAGLDMYRKIGTKSMSITSKDISLIDELHASAKIYWRYTYEKDGKEGFIDFHVFYFLNFVDGNPKIFSYIAGDEQRALKEHGLVPETAEV
jgi:hypothetical protein